MISIFEYIAWRQPDVALILMLRLATARLEAIREQYSFRWWARLMQEPPKPGLGGLLPGEKAEEIVC